MSVIRSSADCKFLSLKAYKSLVKLRVLGFLVLSSNVASCSMSSLGLRFLLGFSLLCDM